MKKNKSLIIFLITILVTFAFIGTATGETSQYHIYLPVVSTPLLENPPVALNDNYSTNENTQLVVSAPGVLGNDSDANGDTLTALWVSDPIHGNLSLSQDGSFTYSPDSGFTGSDSFTYKVSDGELESNIATVNLTINSVGPSCSSAPTLISPSNGSNSNSLIPTFQWDNGNPSTVTEVHLRIMLNEDDFPDHWVYSVTSYNAYFDEERYDEENLDPDTTYYWIVWLTCDEVESPHSELWSFTTGSDGIISPAPTLISPADGSEIWSSDLPVILDWEAAAGANEYKVVLLKYDKSWGEWYRVWYTIVTETQATIPNLLVQNSFYRWYVQPINDYAIGTASSVWEFETRE